MTALKWSITGRSTSTSFSIWPLDFAKLWDLLELVWRDYCELSIHSSHEVWASFSLLLRLGLLGGEEVLSCDGILQLSLLSLLQSLFLFPPSNALDTDRFGGVGMWGTSLGEIELKDSEICIIPCFVSVCSTAFSEPTFLPFCRPSSSQTPWLV